VAVRARALGGSLDWVGGDLPNADSPREGVIQ
ncbi:uncharacterized protein METZ01_LOCUS173455, partial [marine metagenome]